MYSKVYSAQSGPVSAKLITIELSRKEGVPQLTVVGLPDKAVEEAKDRVSSAIDNSDFEKDSEFKTLKSIFAKITISLAPADLKKSGSLFDLPIAVAYLENMGEIPKTEKKFLFAGELALNGDLRAIKGAVSIAKLAKEKSFDALFLPKVNEHEGALIDGIDVYGLENLKDLVLFLRGEIKLKKAEKKNFKASKTSFKGNMLDDIKGQESAKRALIVAAAGGHNIALYGPPGTGKSMLAKVLSSLLPDLDEESAIEVSGIHSSAGVLHETVLFRPPIRAPHHSSSYAAVIGGGKNISPGEISLAHKGVLFMDEFPEFDRRVINALREPMEERKITVSRVSGSELFPADFILIVAMNPCPCGMYGYGPCKCAPSSIMRYQNKISGPVADRIDIWVELDNVEFDKLLSEKSSKGEQHERAKKTVSKVRELQKRRFSKNSFLNAHMSARDIEKYIKLGDEEKEILKSAGEKMSLSGRSLHKIIKVSRTIADIEESQEIKSEHILEALQYKETLKVI